MLRSISEIVPVEVANIPPELKTLDRWAIWKPEPSLDNPSVLGKSPYHGRIPTSRTSHSEPMSWTGFGTAIATYDAREENGAGGVVIALGDGLAGVDLDDAVDPVTGRPIAWAQRIIDRLRSYTEFSVSGRGIRIFVWAPEAPGKRTGAIEVYSRQRFMTVTGRRVPGTPATVEHRADELAALRDELEQARNATRPAIVPSRAGGPPASEIFPGVTALGIPDDEIIVRAREVCGDRFEELWAGDTSAYDDDESRADLALAGYLAFMCGPGEHERVASLMRQSGLVRPKWDRDDYLPVRTIPRAYEGREDFYHWQVVPGVGRRSTQQAAAVHDVSQDGGPQPGPGVAMAVQPGPEAEGTSRAEPECPAGDGGAENGAAGDGGPVPPPIGMARPTIVIGPETDAILTELEGHMSELVFQRHDQLVQIIKHQDGGCRGITRQPGAAVITAVTVEQVQRLLSRHIRFVRLEEEKEDGSQSSEDSAGDADSPGGQRSRPRRRRKRTYKQIAAPKNLAQLLVKCGQWRHIPHLSGLATSPFLREDGTVVSTPGHDPESGYYLVDTGTERRAVPDQPTPEDVAAAVDMLQNLVTDFPFVGPEHRSAWISALLTVVARPAISGPVPLLWLDGNRQGTGKSKLGHLIGIITAGKTPTQLSWTAEEQEMENKITSLLLGGDPLAVFDNAAGSLRNPVLERFLTCSEFGARKFFGQQLLKMPNRTTLVITGNNLTLRGDLGRRVIQCRLATELEQPEARDDFQHRAIERYALENRPALLAAALTILRAHAVTGFAPVMVPVTNKDGTVTEVAARPVGSFERWDEVVRHAALRAGLADPIATQSVVIAEDEDNVRIQALLEQWHKASKGAAWTVTKLLEDVFGRSGMGEPIPVRQELASALWELTGTPPGKMPDTRLLGYKLRDVVDKTVNKYCLRRDRKTNSGVTYLVECSEEGCVHCAEKRSSS